MKWQCEGIHEVERALRSDVGMGLSQREAAVRREVYGENKMQEKKPISLWRRLFAKLNDFMIIVLLIAAGVSYFTSVLQGAPDLLEPLIILAIIVLNAVLGVVQEARAEKSLEALKKMTAPAARVKREGKTAVLPARVLVPGDVILLETGDIIPADGRLVLSAGLKTDESSLTGESHAAEKDAACLCKADSGIGDRRNMVFAGTSVSSGRAEVLVVATAMDTQMGKIAGMIQAETPPETPLQQKLAATGKLLGIGALAVCLLVFVIGILYKLPYFEMFMTSVSLAVAAIPEGLPAIVTIMLAIGVQRMAKRGAIVRQLPAVETLGSATVICSDKTGTLTQNKMKVVAAADGAGEIKPTDERARALIRLGMLCNDCVVDENGNALGDATEKALVYAGKTFGMSKSALERKAKRLSGIPFDPKRKLMTTAHKEQGSAAYTIITKGAPEFLLEKCSGYLDGAQVMPLTKEKRKQLLAINSDMARRALRVIGIARKEVARIAPVLKERAVESDLIFVGFVGMIDPPRKEAADAVAQCKRAGIRPVMITGDHALTAGAVAAMVGIADVGAQTITGKEIEAMDDERLRGVIEDYSVFARVSPAHKVRIVKAFQAHGHVVAMTGDGVNDAPALKAADIGCAMGITGTDVAKNAADIVLTDDNFSTIVAAVRQGRGIYENIRKSAHFLLSSNIGEIITIFVGILMGLPSPLLAIQLLWVNLVTDSLPAIALGMEPANERDMERPPHKSRDSLFSGGLGTVIGLEGCMIGMLALVAFLFGKYHFDGTGAPTCGRTMAFAVLSLSQLVHAFNMKSGRSVINRQIWDNKYLWGAFAVGILLQVSVITVPALATVFAVAPLPAAGWRMVVLLSVMPIVLVELQKAVARLTDGRGKKAQGRLRIRTGN